MPAAKKSKRTDQASASTASEPSATPQFTPRLSTATVGSSWEADPLLIPSNLIPDTEENIAETYRQHWPQIQTRFSCQNRLKDWYNFRPSTISPTALREQLNRTFSDQPTVFKVNFAFDGPKRKQATEQHDSSLAGFQYSDEMEIIVNKLMANMDHH